MQPLIGALCRDLRTSATALDAEATETRNTEPTITAMRPATSGERTLTQPRPVSLVLSSCGNQRDDAQDKESDRGNEKSAVRRPSERSRPAKDFTLRA